MDISCEGQTSSSIVIKPEADFTCSYCGYPVQLPHGAQPKECEPICIYCNVTKQAKLLGEKFKCEAGGCTFSFWNVSSLKRHYRVFHVEVTNVCSVCATKLTGGVRNKSHDCLKQCSCLNTNCKSCSAFVCCVCFERFSFEREVDYMEHMYSCFRQTCFPPVKVKSVYSRCTTCFGIFCDIKGNVQVCRKCKTLGKKHFRFSCSDCKALFYSLDVFVLHTRSLHATLKCCEVCSRQLSHGLSHSHKEVENCNCLRPFCKACFAYVCLRCRPYFMCKERLMFDQHVRDCSLTSLNLLLKVQIVYLQNARGGILQLIVPVESTENGDTAKKLVHSGDKPFQTRPCEMCGTEVFVLKFQKGAGNLCENCSIKEKSVKHDLAPRKDEPIPLKFQCDVCASSFMGLNSLLYHFRRSHSKLGLLICHVCGSYFKSKKELASHSHEEKISCSCKEMCCKVCAAFVCRYCTKIFHCEEGYLFRMHSKLCEKSKSPASHPSIVPENPVLHPDSFSSAYYEPTLGIKLEDDTVGMDFGTCAPIEILPLDVKKELFEHNTGTEEGFLYNSQHNIGPDDTETINTTNFHSDTAGGIGKVKRAIGCVVPLTNSSGLNDANNSYLVAKEESSIKDERKLLSLSIGDSLFHSESSHHLEETLGVSSYISGPKLESSDPSSPALFQIKEEEIDFFSDANSEQSNIHLHGLFQEDTLESAAESVSFKREDENTQDASPAKRPRLNKMPTLDEEAERNAKRECCACNAQRIHNGQYCEYCRIIGIQSLFPNKFHCKINKCAFQFWSLDALEKHTQSKHHGGYKYCHVCQAQASVKHKCVQPKVEACDCRSKSCFTCVAYVCSVCLRTFKKDQKQLFYAHLTKLCDRIIPRKLSSSYISRKCFDCLEIYHIHENETIDTLAENLCKHCKKIRKSSFPKKFQCLVPECDMLFWNLPSLLHHNKLFHFEESLCDDCGQLIGYGRQCPPSQHMCLCRRRECVFCVAYTCKMCKTSFHFGNARKFKMHRKLHVTCSQCRQDYLWTTQDLADSGLCHNCKQLNDWDPETLCAPAMSSGLPKDNAQSHVPKEKENLAAALPLKFKCWFCNNSFLGINSLLSHNVRVHKDRYICTICAQQFTEERDYAQHDHKDLLACKCSDISCRVCAGYVCRKCYRFFRCDEDHKFKNHVCVKK